MCYLLPVLYVTFVFLRAHGSLEGGLAVDYVPLEGDALYEFSWAGSMASAQAEDVEILHSLEEGIIILNYYSTDY